MDFHTQISLKTNVSNNRSAGILPVAADKVPVLQNSCAT